MNKEMISQDIL